MYHVYILASGKKETLYVGSSSEIVKRATQHKQGLVDGFTKKYGVNKLVHFEEAQDAYAMVTRERQIKKWKRQWKINLIEKTNPEWKDLYETLF